MTTKPIFNAVLADKVLEQITVVRPELWDQSSWGELLECGTAMCFAGWATSLEGLRMTHNDWDEKIEAVGYNYDRVTDPTTGAVYGVGEKATELLGLTPYQADLLFNGSNQLYHLYFYLNTFSGGAIEIPEQMQEILTLLEFEEYFTAMEEIQVQHDGLRQECFAGCCTQENDDARYRLYRQRDALEDQFGELQDQHEDRIELLTADLKARLAGFQ